MNYCIYCDGVLVYSPFNRELALANAKYEAEMNCIPYLEFSLFENHPCYNIFNKMTSVIILKRDSEEIFKGRVLNEETGLYGEKKVICEGELSYLLDSVQEPYSFLGLNNGVSVQNLFRAFINYHNGTVNSEKRFTVGNITVRTKNDIIMRSNSTYLNTYESIMRKLIDSCGGVIKIRYNNGVRYIDYVDESSSVCTQVIRFGENIFDIYRKVKGQDIFTGIVPLGATVTDNTRTRITISDVNGGVNYLVNNTAAARYGIILKPVIWEGITDKNILKQKGTEYIGNAGIPSESIELDAFDLSYANTGTDSFNAGDYVRIVSDFHGIDSGYTVRKIKINLLKPEENRLFLGNAGSPLTSEMKKLNNKSKSDLISLYENTDNRLSELFGCISLDENGITVNGRITQEQSSLPVFNNGWGNYMNGYSSVKYFKDSCSVVHISGNVKKEADAYGIIFTLPLYYRPDEKEIFVCPSDNGLCSVEIDTDGNVIPDSDFSGNRISLSGINFKTGD